jgi:hypothetical protein
VALRRADANFQHADELWEHCRKIKVAEFAESFFFFLPQ